MTSSKTLIIFDYPLLGKYRNQDKPLEKKIKKRVASSTLFILLYEIIGYLKNKINNLNKEILSYGEEDLIDLFYKEGEINESNLQFLFKVDNFIELKYFICKEYSEEFLNEQLYLANNFDKLKNKLEEFYKLIYIINEKNQKQKYNVDQKIEYLEYNYYDMNYRELFSFFSFLTDEESEKLANTDGYRYFMTFFQDNGKKY